MDAAAFRIFVREMFPHEKELKSFQARVRFCESS
jgi:hypothetical protein